MTPIACPSLLARLKRNSFLKMSGERGEGVWMFEIVVCLHVLHHKLNVKKLETIILGYMSKQVNQLGVVNITTELLEMLGWSFFIAP